MNCACACVRVYVCVVCVRGLPQCGEINVQSENFRREGKIFGRRSRRHVRYVTTEYDAFCGGSTLYTVDTASNTNTHALSIIKRTVRLTAYLRESIIYQKISLKMIFFTLKQFDREQARRTRILFGR